MADTLIIVESPTKARTISKFLSSRYQVKASVGHVRDLPKSRFGIDLENNYEPDYITIRGKGKLLKELRTAARKAKRVLLATDPDREGEAISWHLAIALGLDLSSKCRVEFHEITPKAVKEAFKNPRTLDMSYVDAQQARRILDRIFGYQLSPFLWHKLRYGLSAGRVQSVALRLICEREEEIQAFIPQEHWSIEMRLRGETGVMTGRLASSHGSKPKLDCEADVQALLAPLPNVLTVRSVRRSERTRQPLATYTTSTLQQDAAHRLGYSARKTMQIAQQLYEGIDLDKAGTVGLITYMRTDSTTISDDAFVAAQAFLLEHYGEAYCIPAKRVFPQRKGAQEAHEAIRPTDITRRPEEIKPFLSRDQHRLYKLIWERFMAAQSAPALLDTMQADLPEGDHVFRVSGSVLRFKGFLALFSSDDEDADADNNNFLPELEVGMELKVEEWLPQQHFTQPAPRFGEALLIKTLEELGIGRPSTYATTVDTLLKRGYTTTESKRLHPTELGQAVNQLLVDHFQMVVETEFTAQIEGALDEVEAGDRPWQNVVGDFYTPFSQLITRAEEEVKAIEWADEITDELCPICGKNLAIKRGRFGVFLACSGYPDCQYTKSIVHDTGVVCVKCGEGTLLERKSRRGDRRFYGCSRYPECDFVSWEKPISKVCPECGTEAMSEKPMKRAQMMRYTCLNPACGHQLLVPLDELEEDEHEAPDDRREAAYPADGGETHG